MAKITDDEELVENVLDNQIVTNVMNSNTKGHKCEICEKIYKTKISLKNHFNFVHNNVGKTFKCNIWSKCYQSKRQLQLHNMTYHEGQKNFKCEFC